MLRRWMIISVMTGVFIAGCNNSDGSGMVKEVQAELRQDDKKTKGKKDKDKKNKKKDEKKGKGEEGGAAANSASGAVDVLQSWDMPQALTEVSGIAWYGEEKVAAVQDELGVIFIFNLRDNKIEKTISFAGKGDYEGVAVVNDMFYVLRSDGTIIEVKDSTSKEYDTPLSQQQDTEGLFYDKANNRLLVAIKAQDPANANSKGIYSFDLATHKMSSRPVFTIDLGHQLLAGKKTNERFQPSEIAVDPTSGDIYITDGADPSLMIMNSKGEIRALHKLDRNIFKQPEGITISPEGELYISSEGVKGSGSVNKVSLKDQNEEI